MIRKEIHKQLTAHIPELEGRVFPLIMPQDTKKTSVVYRIIGSQDTTGLSCTTPIDTISGVQLDIFAHTYEESVDMLNKVLSVLRTEFISSNVNTYEDYANITLKYRQIIDLGLKVKPVYGVPPVAPHTNIVNHGSLVTNHGVQVIA